MGMVGVVLLWVVRREGKGGVVLGVLGLLHKQAVLKLVGMLILLLVVSCKC